jgi:hypothetical protein
MIRRMAINSKMFADHVKGLHSGATILERVAIIAGALGIAGGIAVAFTSHSDSSGLGSTHPYVGLGVALAVGAFVMGVLWWTIARGYSVFALHVASQNKLDIKVGKRAAPGWYPDPSKTDGSEWYWDGSQYTERRGPSKQTDET